MKFSFWPPVLLAAAFALAAPAVRAQADTDPLPTSPSPQELTVDNNIDYANRMLRNRRSYDDNEGGVEDGAYRIIRYRYKVPLQFTFDRSFAEVVTPKGDYVSRIINQFCDAIQQYYNPNNSAITYFRQKLLKIKRVNFTTTKTRPTNERYGAAAGYLLSWNPTTATLTAALYNGPPPRNYSGLNEEYIKDFIKEQVK